MFPRIKQSLSAGLAALLLLSLLLLAAEALLRYFADPFSVITARTARQFQPILTVSDRYHHDLPAGRTFRNTGADGRQISLRTNLLGCRGPAFSKDTSPQDYRILVLGDETVFGGHVQEEATLPARIAQLMRGMTTLSLEVINGGVPGYCPLLSRLKFQHTLQVLKPQLVILHVDMSDLADEEAFRSFLETSAGVESCQHPAALLNAETQTGVLQQSALLNQILTGLRHDGAGVLSIRGESCGLYRYHWITDEKSDFRIQTGHLLESISRLNEQVRSSGGHLLVSTCPVIWQLHDCGRYRELNELCQVRARTPITSTRPFDTLAEYCEVSNIHFVSCLDDFRQRADSEDCFDEQLPFLSEQGLMLYARSIAEYLSSNPPARWPE